MREYIAIDTEMPLAHFTSVPPTLTHALYDIPLCLSLPLPSPRNHLPLAPPRSRGKRGQARETRRRHPRGAPWYFDPIPEWEEVVV
jgi:hypothetical protein